MTPYEDYTIRSVCKSWVVHIRGITQGQHPIGDIGGGGVYEKKKLLVKDVKSKSSSRKLSFMGL